MSAPAIDPSDEWLKAIQSWGQLRFGDWNLVEPDFGLDAGWRVAHVDLVDVTAKQFFPLLNCQPLVPNSFKVSEIGHDLFAKVAAIRWFTRFSASPRVTRTESR